MNAVATFEPTFSPALLGAGGADASALLAQADGCARTHGAWPAADGEAFLSRIARAAGSPAQRAEIERQRDHIIRRAAGGRVRRSPGGPAQDILFDLAAPIAALLHDGHRREANVLANRYLDVAPQGAAGWALLPLYLSLRLAELTRRDLAETALAPSPSRLVVIGGLSGSGKSMLARLLGCRLGRGPGARVVRSDVFRKRLAGVAPETRLAPEHYTLQSDSETYEAMFESAEDHLACGSAVVIDAVFMRRSERDVAEALAARARAPFVGIWLEAPERDRVTRIAARTGDASDATEAVAREQSRRSVGEIHWHRIRTNRPLESIVASARGAIEGARR
jgi:predicted kinase